MPAEGSGRETRGHAHQQRMVPETAAGRDYRHTDECDHPRSGMTLKDMELAEAFCWTA
jgi:hypothetical protein